MPETMSANLSANPGDWETLLRQLNYTFQDIYSKLDQAFGYRGGIVQSLQYGGLGVDVSAYSGLVGISGGAAQQITVGLGLQLLSQILSAKLDPTGGLSVTSAGLAVSVAVASGFGIPTDKTISGGAIAVAGTYKFRFHNILTEGGAASDDMDTVTGGDVGDLLLLQAANAGQVVVCKNGASLIMQEAEDFSLDSVNDKLLLICNTADVWHELLRASNA
jgi:hypothetical protein